MALLGAVMLLGQDVIDHAILASMNPDSFYVPANRIVWEAIVELGTRNRPVDMVCIENELRRTGNLDRIGSAMYLQSCCDKCHTPSQYAYYAKIVMDKWLRRAVIGKCGDISTDAHDAEDAEELRSRAEYDMATLRIDKSEPDTPQQCLDRQFKAWKIAQDRGCVGIQTGFQFIDKGFGGLVDAGMYVLSGKKACGKTTLARNITENLGMRRVPVGYCTLEQTSEQIWGSIAARAAKQSVFKLNCGFRGVDFHKLIAARAQVCQWPIYVDDKSKTPTQLWSWARRMVTRNKCRLLVLDYLQALAVERNYNSDESKITDFSATVRSIAKDLRVAFIVISALSNEGHLRGSGMIGYDAWCHVNLAKADDWTGQNLHYLAKTEKQRFGPETDDAHLYLVGDEQRFTERDDDGKETEPNWYDDRNDAAGNPEPAEDMAQTEPGPSRSVGCGRDLRAPVGPEPESVPSQDAGDEEEPPF